MKTILACPFHYFLTQYNHINEELKNTWEPYVQVNQKFFVIRHSFGLMPID